MKIAILGTVTGRSAETRLLADMMIELSKKHQVAVLATDVTGLPKAGIIPCRSKNDMSEWAETLKAEVLFTFHPELMVPRSDRVNICVVLGKYSTTKLEKYDLVVSPFRDIKESLNDKGFYCIRVPLQANTKAFADLGLKRKYKLGMIGIDPKSLVNADDECLVLSNSLESFDILKWSKLLGKKITVLVEKDDNTLVKFYNSIEKCMVVRPDDYSTLHALACGVNVILPDGNKIVRFSAEHIGKSHWLKLVENVKKHIGKRDEWQKYQILQS